MAERKKAFMKLEDCIKSAMIDLGENSTHLYQRFMAWAIRGVNELGYDVFRNFKRTYIGVDSATQTAALPDDFVQYVSLGLVTGNNEFVPLVYNPSIILNVVTPDCEEVSSHCDCGCNDELCYAIGQSNVTTDTETVTINGTDYTKTTTVCTDSQGRVTRKICQPVVTNPTTLCDYDIDIDPDTYLLPYTNAYFTKNNGTSNVGDVADYLIVLKDVFEENGFTVTTGVTPSSLSASITQTADIWTSFTATDSTGATFTVNFVQSNCTQPTPTVETYCYEETLCTVETLPCGCIVPTQTEIDVICNCCQFLIAATSRYRNNKDFGQTFNQPIGEFGEFNIDYYAGIIKFNTDYQYDTVYLEYYSANEVDSKDYLVPVQAEEAIAAYIKYKYKYNKNNVPMSEKMMLERQWYNEKKKLAMRLKPIRLDELMQVYRMNPAP
jgi:hypothetical protein